MFRQEVWLGRLPNTSYGQEWLINLIINGRSVLIMRIKRTLSPFLALIAFLPSILRFKTLLANSLRINVGGCAEVDILV